MAQKGFVGDGVLLDVKDAKQEKRFDYNVWKNVGIYDEDGKKKTKGVGCEKSKDYIVTNNVNGQEVESTIGSFWARGGQWIWNVTPLKQEVQYKSKQAAQAAIEKLYTMGVYGMFRIAKDLKTGKYVIHTTSAN